MKTMGLISVILALFLISFNCNIKLSTSRKNGHLDSRNFISIPTNSVGQRTCTCIMPNSCSCCEIVKIFYTGDERRLCFNMVYQRNGLNFDLSLDSTIMKSMTVANYRPFQMCASVPGLLLTSICVNVLDINQLSGSVVVCPRLEVSTKLQRWHISYNCQNVSTNLPAGIAPLTAASPAPVQVMMMPAMAMRPTMMMVPMMPAAPGGAAPPRPAGTPGVMMMVPMMPAAASVGATSPRPAAPAAPGQQMMPIAGMMVMGMRPAAPAMMPAAAPAAGAGPAGARPAAAAAMIPAGAPAAAAGARPPGPPAAPAAVPPAGTPPAAGAARPPGAPPPMAAMMVPSGVIVPRPADALVYSLEPLYLSSPNGLSNFTAQEPVDTQPIKREAIRVDSTIIPDQVDHVEQPSSTETDTGSAALVDGGEVEVTTETVFEETTDHEESTIEDATESEQAESSRILKRRKRQYDIFDVFHQSNRCERAYRICITRANNYIISRLRNTRIDNNKNINKDCNDRPTKIVHGSADHLCSYMTSTIANNSGGGSVSFESNSSNSQNSDTLDAIVVHDELVEDSDFYSQNYPQIASITPYNKPRIFPPRTPPLIASQLEEHLKNLTDDTLIIGRM